jgi:hypothetical protein
MRYLAALIVLAFPPLANAAHPFLTEDPGTQGAGHYELELGFEARQGDPSIPGRANQFAPQFSIGVLDNLDLIAQAFWLSQTPTAAPTLLGTGDLTLDFKWRFYEKDNLAFGVRAGADMPTDTDTALGADQLGGHVIGIVSVSFGQYTVYGNAAYAYTRQPGTRRNLGGFSIALTRPDDHPLQTFVEVAASSNPDPSNPQWPAVARVGGIYTVTSWMDVDAGFQARLNRSATRAAYLLGATVRW